jgi:hypothetical protein
MKSLDTVNGGLWMPRTREGPGAVGWGRSRWVSLAARHKEDDR